MTPEERIHTALADYLKLQYPSVLFISESSGVRTSIGLAKKLKRTRSNHVHLDLYVLERRGEYGALILELKAKSVFKKDGTLIKSDHVHDQAETIKKLNNKGYLATFACSFDEAKKIIDNYLCQSPSSN